MNEMSAVETVDTVVVGAGHAGLAVSRLLTDAGRDHVVLDRGRIAERWRSERWDSLHLLTPSWMLRLPGWYPVGRDPEEFLSAAALVRYLERYAASFGAPVRDRTTVLRVEPLGSLPDHTGSGDRGSRYRVVTDRGTWLTRNLVTATGPHGTPRVPAGLATAVQDADATVVASNRYKNPAMLPAGGVLVVGASSSGVQIADELARSGREVTLAVGRHTRMPRRYRGMDIFWWLEATGRLGRTIDSMPDPAAARREPSMQLVGRNEPSERARDLDLRSLQRRGVRLAGHLDQVAAGVARFRDDLADTAAAADARMHKFLDAVDGYVDRVGLTREVWTGVRPRPVRATEPVTAVDLRADGIGSVVLATGYRPDNSWLGLPVLGAGGGIAQRRGVTALPGLYVVGQRFQHRRDSGFIDGARHDAHAVVAHLLGRDRAAVRTEAGAGGRAADRTGAEPAA